MARAPAVADAEVLPEADRLEGFPHPRETVRVLGHDGPARDLAEAFASGRMHHAWLLTGPRGIGKATLAYAFARYALVEPDQRGRNDLLGGGFALDVASDAQAARQVTVLSHPGLLLLRRPYDIKDKRLRTAITVEEVRRLRGFLGHTAGDGAWRVVIVDAVDDLNVAAANALLKSLEEPPRRTVFLLICAEPGGLLATIRSRCRLLTIPALGDTDLKAAAVQAIAAASGMAVEDTAWPRLLPLARGSVRRLLALAAVDGLKLADDVDAMLALLPKVDWTKAHALADQLAPVAAEQRFNAFFDLLSEALSDIARDAALGLLTDGMRGRLAGRLAASGALASWAAMWETVVRERADAQLLNLDRKALILDTLARIETVARRL